MTTNMMPVRDIAREAGISVTTLQDWIYAREPEVRGHEKLAGSWWLPRKLGEQLTENLKRARALAGPEIRRIRLAAGFSQADLARLLNLSGEWTVSLWETERRRPGSLTALRLRLLLDRIEAGDLRRPGGPSAKIDQDPTTRRERASAGRVSITRAKRETEGAA